MLARLKNDFELAEYGYRSRTASEDWTGLSSTPETVRLMAARIDAGRIRLTGKRVVKLNTIHQAHVRRLNSEPAYRYILVPKAGWFNTGVWKAESIGFGDNLVEVVRKLGRFAQIKTIDYYDTGISHLTYESHPELVHRFTVVTKKGTLIKPARRLDVYIFLISKVPLWIKLDKLDFENLN